MDPMVEFNIPIQGLESGQHTFHFEVSDDFFKQFERALVEKGTFQVTVDLDKQSSMIVCDFEISGTLDTTCDRCLENIQMPVFNEIQLLFKYAEEEMEEDEIVYIPRGLNMLNLGKYIYEMISLSIPMVKQYDCENDEEAPCNEEVLKRLSGSTDSTLDDDGNPIWDILKGIKDN